MIALILIGCATTEEAPETKRRAPNASAMRVEVARLDHADQARMELSVPGEVEGSKDVVLSAALGGTVERVLVHKGQPVRAGQVLARIDAEIYAAQLAQAEAQQAQAQIEFDRLEKLGDLAANTTRVQAETTLKVANAQVKAARAQYSRAVIKAPFSGIAADVGPEVGEFLGPGSPVARVVQLDPIHVSLAVADRDVVGLEPDMGVTVQTAAVSTPFRGHVAHVGRAADLRTRSFPVDVAVDNPDGLLLPGMIATVQLERDLPSGTLAIPQDWVVSRRTGQGVFVESDGFARWTDITLGEVLHDQVVVTSGLEPGARLIVSGQRDLVDGDAVLVAREGVCCERGRPVFGG